MMLILHFRPKVKLEKHSTHGADPIYGVLTEPTLR
jgi:hypothetical protein